MNSHAMPIAGPAPVLETARLVLRMPDARDAEGFIRFYGDPRSRHIDGPQDRATAWRMFATEIGHWHLRGFGMWAVCLRDAPDQALGIVGAWCPDGWPEREVGWLLWPESEGRGIGYEAGRAALDHAFGVWGWDTAVSYIAPENARSIDLAARLGALHDPHARRPDDKPGCLVYRHSPQDGGMEAYA